MIRDVRLDERPARPAGPAERGPKYGLQLRAGVRGADRRGLAAERRPGVHDAAAARARRARRVGRRPPTDGPQKRFRITADGERRAGRVAADAAGPERRRPATSWSSRCWSPCGVPGVDVHEVIQAHRRYLVELMQQWTRLKEDEADFDLELRAGGRRRAVPAGFGRALAGRRRRPPEAAPPLEPPAAGAAVRPLPQAPAEESEVTAMSRARAARRVEGLRRGADRGARAARRRPRRSTAGELVAVMGPSGSGKSTLLTIAGSLEEPTRGEVLVGGAALSAMSRNDRARLRRRSIGYVFQDFNLLAGLTAVENVALPLELDGVARQDGPRRRPWRPWTSSGLADRASRFPDELSGGERQRVAIARAVVGDRRLLLADEPSGALDSVNGEAVMRLLRAACRRGVAAVVVTHDAQLASWADRVVFLRDGRVVDQTAPPRRPRVAAGDGPEAVTATLTRRRSSRTRHRHGPANGGGAGPPGRDPLGVAAVPPRVAAAAAGAGAAHRGRRRPPRRGRRGRQTPPPSDARFGRRPGPDRVAGRSGPLAADRIAAIRHRFGTRRRDRAPSLPVPGLVSTVDLRAQDPAGPFGAADARPASAGATRAGPARSRVDRAAAARPCTSAVGGRGSRDGRHRRVDRHGREPAEPGWTSSPWSPRARSTRRSRSPSCSTRTGSMRTPFGPDHRGAASASRGPNRGRPARPSPWPWPPSDCCWCPWSAGRLRGGGPAPAAPARPARLGRRHRRQLRLVLRANGTVIGTRGRGVGTAVGLAAWLAAGRCRGRPDT